MLSKGGVRRGFTLVEERKTLVWNVAIIPVAKPRMTNRDKWIKRPGVLKYRAFCDEVRLKVKSGPPQVSVSFYMPMPQSWYKTQKARMDGQPHQVRPDLDNLIKAWCDALYPEDSVIWSIHATKFWAYKGSISYEA
jgi:Holliday junction resolvase RusA-like endonuclease